MKNLKEQVDKMKVSEIIQAMVDALINPITEINMGTFGFIGENGICFGCAATNTILSVCDIEMTPDWEYIFTRAEDLNVGRAYLKSFEFSIDSLRKGDILDFLSYLIEIKPISFDDLNKIEGLNSDELVYLDNDYEEVDLIPYQEFVYKLKNLNL